MSDEYSAFTHYSLLITQDYLRTGFFEPLTYYHTLLFSQENIPNKVSSYHWSAICSAHTGITLHLMEG